jgi:hypothetical protein
MTKSLRTANLICLFVFIQSFQLDSQIDYNQYLYPDVDFHSLNTEFAFAGNNSSFQLTNILGQDGKQNYTLLNLNGSVFHNRIINTREKQRLIRNSFYGFYSKTRDEGFLRDFKENILNFQFFHNNTLRNYSAENNYTELLYGISARYNHLNRNENISSTLAFAPALGFRVGNGRTEPARELFDAMFILDDLRKKDYVLVGESQNLIFEMAQLMAVARQTRLLDFRVQRIHQLELIAEWLREHMDEVSQREQNLLTVIVADNWNYNIFNDRSIGDRKSIGIETRYNFSKFRNENPVTSFVAVLYGEIYKTEPLSRYFHRSTAIFPGLHYRRSLSGLTQDRYFPFINSVVDYSYFPNSRTRLSMNGGADISYLPKDFVFDEAGSVNLRPFIGLGAEYFINYQFRILADILTSYSYSSKNNFVPINTIRHEVYGSVSSLVPLFESPIFNDPNLFVNYSSRIALDYNIRFLYSFF